VIVLFRVLCIVSAVPDGKRGSRDERTR